MSQDWSALADLPLVATRNVFGVPVVYERASVSQEIRGIFSAPGTVRTLASGIQVETTDPILAVRFADLTSFGSIAKQGDRFSVAGQHYRVARVIPDGNGGAELIGEQQL